MSEMERTFVMIKPDGVARGLIAEIVGRLERKGLKPVGMKLMQISPPLAEDHYFQHRERPFFPGLISFITSGPVFAMVWEGKGAVGIVRGIMGPTNPAEAPPGTIRGDLAMDIGGNVVHGSDSAEAATREISLFFRPEELLDYAKAGAAWVYPE